jgi:hypothetical protein
MTDTELQQPTTLAGPYRSRTIYLAVEDAEGRTRPGGISITREWVQSRWEVVVRDGETGEERSRRGYDTLAHTIDAMAERARQYAQEVG